MNHRRGMQKAPETAFRGLCALELATTANLPPCGLAPRLRDDVRKAIAVCKPFHFELVEALQRVIAQLHARLIDWSDGYPGRQGFGRQRASERNCGAHAK